VITNLTNQRLELWGCLKLIIGTTTITATLGGTQSYEYIIEKYSGANAFGQISTFNATSILSLTLTTVFSQNADLMVGMFNWDNSTSVTVPATSPPNGTILRSANAGGGYPLRSIQRQESGALSWF
jgi:hypothetical protein